MTMEPFPHTYVASAAAQSAAVVTVGSPGLPDIATSSPPEFGGPGGVWSPETLLCAALADCFILTFRAGARAARLEWLQLECRVEGLLDRVDRMSQFVRYTTSATLTVGPGVDLDKANRLLEAAERGCLIANSLTGARILHAKVVVADR